MNIGRARLEPAHAGPVRPGDHRLGAVPSVAPDVGRASGRPRRHVRRPRRAAGPRRPAVPRSRGRHPARSRRPRSGAGGGVRRVVVRLRRRRRDVRLAPAARRPLDRRRAVRNVPGPRHAHRRCVVRAAHDDDDVARPTRRRRRLRRLPGALRRRPTGAPRRAARPRRRRGLRPHRTRRPADRRPLGGAGHRRRRRARPVRSPTCRVARRSVAAASSRRTPSATSSCRTSTAGNRRRAIRSTRRPGSPMRSSAQLDLRHLFTSPNFDVFENTAAFPGAAAFTGPLADAPVGGRAPPSSSAVISAARRPCSAAPCRPVGVRRGPAGCRRPGRPVRRAVDDGGRRGERPCRRRVRRAHRLRRGHRRRGRDALRDAVRSRLRALFGQAALWVVALVAASRLRRAGLDLLAGPAAAIDVPSSTSPRTSSCRPSRRRAGDGAARTGRRGGRWAAGGGAGRPTAVPCRRRGGQGGLGRRDVRRRGRAV